MNYKGFKYQPNKKSFMKYCNDFPPLDRGQFREFYRDGNVFLSLEKISHEGYYGKVNFLGATLRRYDEATHEFAIVPVAEQDVYYEEIFVEAIREYERKYSTKLYR